MKICSRRTESRVNRLGRAFINGKALSLCVRQKIIELAEAGIRPCEISRQLRVSHGCISKLLAKYNETGSFEAGHKTPCDVSKYVRRKIKEFKRQDPSMFSWELKEKLLAEGVCTKNTLPPLPLISRILMEKSSEMLELSDDASSESQRKEKHPEPEFSIGNFLGASTGIRNDSLMSELDTTKNDGLGSSTQLFNRTIIYQRRKRITYTEEQIKELKRAYEKAPYLNRLAREELAERLNIPESKIQVWFSNYRSKIKRTTSQGQCNAAPEGVQEHGSVKSRVLIPNFQTAVSFFPHCDARSPATHYPSLAYWQRRLREIDRSELFASCCTTEFTNCQNPL